VAAGSVPSVPPIGAPEVAKPAEQTGQTEPVSVTETLEQLDDTIRCRRCQHGITAGRYAIEVDGAHAHTFRNPAGWSFRLACFADAPGAAPSGRATHEHTWFSGYAWRFAHCGGCGAHVGWWFVGGADAFAGLVLARLM
jgi:hypothetical protein